MPTMFDSHEEFNEWFSKDIESHAEKKSVLDEHQLSRLHLILKPFMLRRIKKDVEHEMADKVRVWGVWCVRMCATICISTPLPPSPSHTHTHTDWGSLELWVVY